MTGGLVLFFEKVGGRDDAGGGRTTKTGKEKR